MSNQLAINGGPKAVTNKLQGWPQFDESAVAAVLRFALSPFRAECEVFR